MGVAFALALALVASWGDYGNNGFNPDWVVLLGNNGGWTFDLQGAEIREWLRTGSIQARRDKLHSLDYLVRCAFERGVVFELPVAQELGIGASWKFRGQYGLLGSLGSVTQPAPITEGDGRVRLVYTDDDLLWVSSCIMAHANLDGAHEYIALRGNPRHRAAREALGRSNAVRWVFGQPEGVFFADLFHRTEEDPLLSYTVSLNLPRGYWKGPGHKKWRPPNARVGRSLDFSEETNHGSPSRRVAALLGAYSEHAASFERAQLPPNQLDPDYAADAVCLSAARCNEKPTLVKCQAGVRRLRPLFVHHPRLANFEAVLNPPSSPPQPFMVVASPALDPRDVEKCGPGCIGAYPYLKAGAAPAEPVPTYPDVSVVRLPEGHTLEARLPFVSAAESSRVQPPREGEDYTAIIRYRCRDSAGCRVTIKRGDANQETPVWAATNGSYAWALAYPVLVKGAALSFSVIGAGGTPPELDAVGFLPGRPDEHCVQERLTVIVDGEESPWNAKDPAGPFWGRCTPWAEAMRPVVIEVPKKPEKSEK